MTANEIVKILINAFGNESSALEYAKRIGMTHGPLAADYLEAAAIIERRIWQTTSKAKVK